MDVSQKKNITLTVIAAILFMATVLALFINKITTPRYLSTIELKINGLVLLNELVNMQAAEPGEQWILLVHNTQQQKAANALLDSLPKKIANSTAVIENTYAYSNLAQENILIANAEQTIIAYFTPTFDRNKMKLTYSSVFTHR